MLFCKVLIPETGACYNKFEHHSVVYPHLYFDRQGNMSTIRLEAKLLKMGEWTILQLPKEVSAKLPSRALTMVKGTISNTPFRAALEPDGRGSHWFKLDEQMLKDAKTKAGDSVTVEMEPTKEW